MKGLAAGERAEERGLDAVRSADRVVLVGEQRERKVEVAGELLVRLHGAVGDANHHSARLFELGNRVAERAHLLGIGSGVRRHNPA